MPVHRTHTKEKQSKISNITFVILSLSGKYSVLCTLESTTFDETIRSASKWFILTLKKNGKSRVG